MTDSNNQDTSESQGFRQPQFNQGGYYTTPNSVPVLVLGILSIVFCWCYGLLSVILAIIALVLAAECEKQYALNPQAYSIASYKNLKAGKTCAVVGLCLAIVSVLMVIIYALVLGTLMFNFWNMGVE
jgi:hypothetical protein